MGFPGGKRAAIGVIAGLVLLVAASAGIYLGTHRGGSVGGAGTAAARAISSPTTSPSTGPVSPRPTGGRPVAATSPVPAAPKPTAPQPAPGSGATPAAPGPTPKMPAVVCVRGALPGATQVTAGDFSFSPSAVTIPVGGSITWTESIGAHTTTSDSGAWNYQFNGSGDAYSCTFHAAGTFSYHCTPHKSLGMVGTITVGKGGGRAARAASATMSAPAAGCCCCCRGSGYDAFERT